MDNTVVIKTLSIYGDSLKKLFKILPENCIKAIPCTIGDVQKYDLEVNINGTIFTGKDDNSCMVINCSNRNYTKEELITFQKIAIKCFTYPFGALVFSFKLNISSNDKSEKAINELLNKYKIVPSKRNMDSEGHIELQISDVRDFAAPSFINFILELQTLTDLLD